MSIVALLAFVVYAIFILIVAIAGEGNGSFFWASLVVIALLAVAALWGAKLMFSRR